MRFRHDNQRRQSIAAHALKRSSLDAATGRRDWRFMEGPDGEPTIAGDQGPHFNCSQCDGLVACAVSRAVPLGINVESIDARKVEPVVVQLFTSDEQGWLAGLSAAAPQRGFVQIWKLKEAFAKATGRGLGRDLRLVATTTNPSASCCRMMRPRRTPAGTASRISWTTTF